MLKAYSVFVALWGLAVTCLPWIIVSDMKHATGVIVSGIGLAIIGSSAAMWRKAASEPR